MRISGSSDLQPALLGHSVCPKSRLKPAVLAFAFASLALAQSPPPPVSGAAGLELMLRRLGSTGVVMITNAHPDDEPNALIAMLVHGLGMRVVECTATRGEGGQNDLGPEQGLALSVLRTEELLSVHRIDGAEQFFARAVDFGYSFSVEETFAKWGKDEILADYVHLIRMIRPDVIITMSPDGAGGGQHHQASARITREAFDAAADPQRFPEQLDQGLRPWQALRLYVPLGGPPAADGGAASRSTETRRAESAPASRPGDVTIDTDVFDPALGCTYNEIGTRARSMHKSQGMARLLALPGPAVSKYRLAAGPVPSEGSQVFTSPDFRRCQPSVQESVTRARAALQSSGPAAAIAPLVEGLRRLRANGKKMESGLPLQDDLFGRQEGEFISAIQIAAGLRFDALADTGVVKPGQEIKVTAYVANRLAPDLQFERVTFEGFDPAEGGCATRPSGPLLAARLVTCESRLKVPESVGGTAAHWKPILGASRDELEPDVPFGAPFRPTQFRAQAHVTCNGEPLVFETPVAFRDGSDVVAGEKRSELIVSSHGGGEVVDYPHISRRMVTYGWRLLFSFPHVKGPNIDFTVGWIRGMGDPSPGTLRDAFGDRIEFFDEPLAYAPFRRYPVIVVGARALELRADVRTKGKDLVKYVEEGGTLIVLYQRSGLDETTAAPYPAKTGPNRITDENASVKLLVPGHPVFSRPSDLRPDSVHMNWSFWVQERGRSFLETKDPRYVDLIEMEDPFEFNKGPKRGILVEARVGKGRWIYTGLSLSRQVEEGVVGGYCVLENLLSLRSAGGSEGPPASSRPVR